MNVELPYVPKERGAFSSSPSYFCSATLCTDKMNLDIREKSRALGIFGSCWFKPALGVLVPYGHVNPR